MDRAGKGARTPAKSAQGVAVGALRPDDDPLTGRTTGAVKARNLEELSMSNTTHTRRRLTDLERQLSRVLQANGRSMDATIERELARLATLGAAELAEIERRARSKPATDIDAAIELELCRHARVRRQAAAGDDGQARQDGQP